MTKSWRPEGWEEDYPQKPLTYDVILDTEAIREHTYFECGADAMLEVLRKSGNSDAISFAKNVLIINPNKTGGRGTFTFIPDDKES